NYSSRATDIITGEQMKFYNQINENKSFQGGISLQVPIFNNNRTKVAVNKAKIGFLQAENEEALARRNLEKTIAQAILDLRSANKHDQASLVSINYPHLGLDMFQVRYDVRLANTMEVVCEQSGMNIVELVLFSRLR